MINSLLKIWNVRWVLTCHLPIFYTCVAVLNSNRSLLIHASFFDSHTVAQVVVAHAIVGFYIWVAYRGQPDEAIEKVTKKQ